MRLSTLFGKTLREAPADAEHIGYQLALRAGLVRQVLAGGYAYLPLGMRVARRIEAIMHEELAGIDGQELRTPVVQASTAWERSGRYAEYGPLMLKFADRSKRPLIFAPTHEEAIADLVRREISSYRQMPALVYQIHTKYRDEMRAKGGLLRMREFTMLDAYTLDADDAGLDVAYERIAGVFERIFERCSVRFVVVEASAGEMGGREPREYMALSQAGEDTLVICPSCGYAANLEVAVSKRTTDEGAGAGRWSVVGGRVEDVATPNCATIADVAAFLGVPTAATAKAVFFDTPERGLLFAVIRGDLEVNEAKLCAAAGISQLAPATAEQIAAAGAVAGYASPVGLRILTAKSAESAQDEEHKDSASFASSAVQENAVFVIADQSVAGGEPLVAGANRDGHHLRNVVYGRDWQATVVADIAAAREGDPCVRCGAGLRFERGIEIGHIFKLGTRFTEALGANYLDQAGTARPVVMGSYGIGVDRLIQVIIEQHHDAAGIVWPAPIAPADVHLVRLGKGETVRAAAEALYDELRTTGVRVLYDDRDETAGVKFNDADLLGMPLRLLVSERLLAEGMVEIKPRGGEAAKIAAGDVVATLSAAS
ncbi:MAG TPA: proline--tRNA ligase [Roseiflexaceae bacterium]|nr:proline--tRNA ligase [Roseiflexaceae bacterium]